MTTLGRTPSGEAGLLFKDYEPIPKCSSLRKFATSESFKRARSGTLHKPRAEDSVLRYNARNHGGGTLQSVRPKSLYHPLPRSASDLTRSSSHQRRASYQALAPASYATLSIRSPVRSHSRQSSQGSSQVLRSSQSFKSSMNSLKSSESIKKNKDAKSSLKRQKSKIPKLNKNASLASSQGSSTRSLKLNLSMKSLLGTSEKSSSTSPAEDEEYDDEHHWMNFEAKSAETSVRRKKSLRELKRTRPMSLQPGVAYKEPVIRVKSSFEDSKEELERRVVCLASVSKEVALLARKKSSDREEAKEVYSETKEVAPRRMSLERVESRRMSLERVETAAQGRVGIFPGKCAKTLSNEASHSKTMPRNVSHNLPDHSTTLPSVMSKTLPRSRELSKEESDDSGTLTRPVMVCKPISRSGSKCEDLEKGSIKEKKVVNVALKKEVKKLVEGVITRMPLKDKKENTAKKVKL